MQEFVRLQERLEQQAEGLSRIESQVEAGEEDRRSDQETYKQR